MGKKKKKKLASSAHAHERPPIVAVLGHVDHGKTTLLDTIRKANVTASETGGITQHIGAYQVRVAIGGNSHLVTFVDTPGHEAFSAMRSRGAHVADIVLLVVAADDSVKPQTIESIKRIQESGAHMIVVVNKIDTPGANQEKVQQDLAKHGVQVEGFGGEVPIVAVSATKAEGIDTLLEMIVLVHEMHRSADTTKKTEAVVIETKVDRGKGMVATLLVKHGVLSPRTPMFDGDVAVGKIRAMFDENGKPVKEAPAGKPVETLGFSTLPEVGSIITSKARAKEPSVAKEEKKDELPDFLKPIEEQEARTLNLILKADTAGSIEAIEGSLGDAFTVVSSGVGEITEADVLQARSSNAFVIGFHVRYRNAVAKLAQTERVVIRTYTIIYELIDELEEVAAGIKEAPTGEKQVGQAQILAEFPFDNTRVAGCKVVSGRFVRGDRIRIMRGEEEVGKGKIASLRKGKEEVNRVDEGEECGVLIDKQVDFAIQDDIIAFT